MHQLVSVSISLPLLLCYPSKLFPVITPHARNTVIPWNAKWKAYQLIWESLFMQARCEAGALQLMRLLHLHVWVAQVPLADGSLPLSTRLFLFPAQQAGSLWERRGVHDEGTHRMCEIIKLSPPLESQRGTAPVVRLWMRCRALAQGLLLNPGWGHQAAWGTQVTLELTSPLRTSLYSYGLIYFVTATWKIKKSTRDVVKRVFPNYIKMLISRVVLGSLQELQEGHWRKKCFSNIYICWKLSNWVTD